MTETTFLARAQALQPGDIDGADALFTEAAAFEPCLSAEEADALVEAVHQAIGGDLQSLKQAWVKAVTDAFRNKADGQADETIFSREDILKLINGLKKYDEEGAKNIVAAVVAAELSALTVASLMKPFAKALGVDLRDAKSFWKAAEEQAKAAAFARPDIREERERAQRDEAERQRAETVAEKDRIWQSCKKIAESPTLLDDMVKIVQRLGVVGEAASIKGAYIAASSRFNAATAICLARLGAPAGGKNFLLTTTFKIIPDDAVVHMSSGSPLSLVYYGGGDENALKYKIVYVPEAAIIAENKGVENILTIMLRLLISEGRLDHNVAVPQGSGPPVTERIKRNGPVVVIVTTARDNIEEELLTRLMTSDADETTKQTKAVVVGALAPEDGGVTRDEIERWLDYQRWLAAEAPYRVTIPYRGAIRAALEKKWTRGEKPRLRMRRDVHGFLTAIKTSAILHRAQRKRDEIGRIVAVVADYAAAHAAFDGGLASLYKVKVPETILAVVRAVADMGATESLGVKVTVRGLMTSLGISSRAVAGDRLHEAAEQGFLELVEKTGGYGRTTARSYKLARPLAEIEAMANPGGVFPTPEEIKNTMGVSMGGQGQRDNEDKQNSLNKTNGLDDENCPGQFSDRSEKIQQNQRSSDVPTVPLTGWEGPDQYINDGGEDQ